MPVPVCGQLVPTGATILTARLDSGQEVPPVTTTATGLGQVVLNAARDQIIASAAYTGLSGAQTLAHMHGPAPIGVSAGVLFNLDPAPAQGGTTGRFDGIWFAITPTQAADLENGLHYFNVHSTTNGGGEVRGQISALDEIFANDFE